MNVVLVKNGVVKDVKVGFSWTTLFFCGFNNFFRGEWLIGIGLLILIIAINLVAPVGGIVHLVYAFFANKVTARRLIADGWVPKDRDDERTRQALIKWEIEV